MKEHLISFVYGLVALAIVSIIVYTIVWLFGEGALVIGLLLVLVWGVGSSIRDTIKEMKENNE